MGTELIKRHSWGGRTPIPRIATTGERPGPLLPRERFDSILTRMGNSSARSASLTSSILNYPFEHGRRYHAFRGKFLVRSFRHRLNWSPTDCH